MPTQQVTLYSKPGCHLCDTARAWLEDFAAAPEQYAPFDLAEVDIRRDDELFARYRLRIPVITLDGAVVAEGRMDDAAWQALAGALTCERF